MATDFKQSLIRVALLLPSLSPCSLAAQEIFNFKSGLACTDGRTHGWICHETTIIPITGQGKCVYNRKELPCTWYGFEFDYSGFEQSTELTCVVNTSHPADWGDPTEELEKNVTETTFSLSVPPGDGHFYNPQYSIFGGLRKKPHTDKRQLACSLNGEEAFRINYEFMYPAMPAQP